MLLLYWWHLQCLLKTCIPAASLLGRHSFSGRQCTMLVLVVLLHLCPGYFASFILSYLSRAGFRENRPVSSAVCSHSLHDSHLEPGTKISQMGSYVWPVTKRLSWGWVGAGKESIKKPEWIFFLKILKLVYRVKGLTVSVLYVCLIDPWSDLAISPLSVSMSPEHSW